MSPNPVVAAAVALLEALGEKPSIRTVAAVIAAGSKKGRAVRWTEIAATLKVLPGNTSGNSPAHPGNYSEHAGQHPGNTPARLRERPRITKESSKPLPIVLPGFQETSSLGDESPKAKNERKPNPPYDLAVWFRSEAVERGLIPVHERGEKATASAMRADLEKAKILLDSYPPAEVKARAIRFLDAVQAGTFERAATVRSFALAWEWKGVGDRPALRVVQSAAQDGPRAYDDNFTRSPLAKGPIAWGEPVNRPLR